MAGGDGRPTLKNLFDQEPQPLREDLDPDVQQRLRELIRRHGPTGVIIIRPGVDLSDPCPICGGSLEQLFGNASCGCSQCGEVYGGETQHEVMCPRCFWVTESPSRGSVPCESCGAFCRAINPDLLRAKAKAEVDAARAKAAGKKEAN